MSPINLTLRFACEIAAIVAVVWWAWPWLGIVLGVVVIAVWGAFVAPKASRRLRDPWRLGVELAIFAGAAAAFAAVGQPVLAVVFAVLAVATALLTRRWSEPV
ncbi:MAG TPA: YrdB family protein [Gaiellaceae bacterium]|jgi:hypothetical protein|nr:YrdB family protein [Gaiellaceae bacterium]